MTLVTEIAILVLAAFVGFEVISKVPNTLHTPLMSGTNAIHGIVVLGGLLLMHEARGVLEHFLLVVAIAFIRVTTSYLQLESQPSRSSLLPSSHCSLPSILPSPHTCITVEMHGLPAIGQV